MAPAQRYSPIEASPTITMTMGLINYLNRAAKRAGGVAALQTRDRLFLVPGLRMLVGERSRKATPLTR